MLKIKTNSKDRIDIYTDGACSGNPGKGGYGIVVVSNGQEIEISDGLPDTTNNEMELVAVVTALESLSEPCCVTVTSDSKYVTDMVNKKWIFNWANKGWKKSDGKTVSNIELCKRFYAQLTRYTDLRFVWVKGHDGHPYNERCDRLATTFIKECL